MSSSVRVEEVEESILPCVTRAPTSETPPPTPSARARLKLARPAEAAPVWRSSSVLVELKPRKSEVVLVRTNGDVIDTEDVPFGSKVRLNATVIPSVDELEMSPFES